MTFLKKIKTILPIKKQQTKKATEYTDLAPIDEITNGNEYLNVLDWALKNSRIKNIALAGPYGAGKSSIIETYLKQHQRIKKHSLRISMATFVENGTDKNGDPKKITIEQDEIELGILKQLFYKVKYKKIPQSRYRKLHKISWKIIWGYLIAICIILSLIVYIFLPDAFNSFIDKIKGAGLGFGLTAGTSYCWFGLLVLGILAVLAKGYRSVLSRFKISEVKFPTDTTLKNNEESKETVFNKNMDEIFYFFEETKYQVVFFEDLDRLEDSSIFIQLRELNTLLNNYEVIKKPIIFVYAVKDDIFTDTDRTKFFDFIIPVIPIINSTNSGEIFLDKLEESKRIGISHEISQGFILDVSPYIEDMRILQNIYNEFVVYKKTLRTEQDLILSDEAMMALIVFKNLYPRDFADIQMEKGIIKQAFEEKNDFVKQQCSIWQKEIDTLTDVILNYDKDVLQSTKELKCAILGGMSGWQGIISGIGEGYNSQYTLNDIMQDNFELSKLCSWRNCKIWYKDRNNTTIDNFRNFFAPYYERWKYLKVAEEKGLTEIQAEIKELEHKIHNISGWSIKKLIEQFSAQEVLSENIRMNKLLVFLLRRGFIDESYANYINYFKGNSITKDDMNFILSVKNMEPLPFSYNLTKTPMIVRRLQVYEFEHKAIYNFNLLEEILFKNLNDAKLNAFITQLSDGEEQSWNFINEFIDTTQQKRIFIRLLAHAWGGMWNYIVDDVVLTYERKIFYLSLLISEAAIDSLVLMNTERKMSAFIESNEDILQRLSPIRSCKVIEAIEALGIVFNNVLIDGVSSEVLDYVFDNHCYNLNPIMIQRIMEYKNNTLVSKLDSQNYTTIINLGYVPLIEYVHKNLLHYMESIVLAECNIKEETEQIIDLLERSIDNTEICLQLISHEEFCLDDIKKCCGGLIDTNKQAVKELWDKLLEENKVYLSWDNVNNYWASYGLTKEIIQYIERYTEKLMLMDCECMSDAFIKKFIFSTINEHAFESLLPKLKLDNFDIKLDKISEERVFTMINCQYFALNATRYDELEMAYPNLCIEFIVHNQDDYMAIMDSIQMDTTFFEKLFFNPHMEQNNIQTLLDTFGIDYMTTKIAGALHSLNLSLNIRLFDVAWKLLDVYGKRQLMISCLDLLDANRFESCFSDLSQWYSGFTDRSRRHDVEIDNTIENNKLAKRLKEVDYITSHNPKNKLDFDPVTGIRKEGTVLLCRVKATK